MIEYSLVERMDLLKDIMMGLKRGFDMTKQIFSRLFVRYEVACDVMGALLTHYSEVIATERDKPVPNLMVISRAQLEKIVLYNLRDALDPNNFAEIESMIKAWGPQAHMLYRGNMNMSKNNFPISSNNNEAKFQKAPIDTLQVCPPSATDEAMEDLLNSMKRLSTDEKRLQEVIKLLV